MTARIEQETICNWNEEEEDVSVYTASPVVMRHCVKIGFKLVKTDTIKGDPCSWWFKCEKSQIRLIKVPKKREFSEQDRLDIAARLRAGKTLMTTKEMPLESQATSQSELPLPPKDLIPPLGNSPPSDQKVSDIESKPDSSSTKAAPQRCEATNKLEEILCQK